MVYSGLSGWVYAHHESLRGRTYFLAMVKDTDVIMEEESERCNIMALKMEWEAMSQGM